MVLNYEQILNNGVLKDFDSNNFRSASYDLKIEQIYDMDGNEKGKLTLAPQGMATIVFKETIFLPDNILAFAHVKTALARIGIMAINIGIIDPGYKGCLSTVIINYGKTAYELKKNDSCLRLTFHQTQKPIIPKPFNYNISKDSYLKDRQIETLKYLGDSFLNLREVERRIEKNVSDWIWKRVAAISMMVAALALTINLANYLLNRDDNVKNNTIETLTTKTENVHEKFLQLENKLQALQDTINKRR
jgi:deoxycytidine triphosphate deaminase